MTTPTPWPQGKTFAFSVIDDTDNATLRSVRPFYDALRHYGLRTTKTVWSLPPAPGNRFTGESLADEAYRAWIQSLAADGFEIGWHGARSGATPRELTIQAHEVFRETLGHWPETYANHAQNADCIYWGRERFDAAEVRAAYGIFRAGPTRFGGSTPARGSIHAVCRFAQTVCACMVFGQRGGKRRCFRCAPASRKCRAFGGRAGRMHCIHPRCERLRS
jgi:hypothetical protein